VPRAAGNSSHYEFVLHRASGSYDKDTVIRLPSVTSIIGSVLSKPLDNWTYGTTVDNISGLVTTLFDGDEVGTYSPARMADLIDTLSDADMLREYLKENRLRPEDVANDASTRGTREHDMLEHLAKAYLESDEVAAEQIARRTLDRDSSSPWAKGIAGWWLEEYPRVMESETVVYSLALGCAGTVDLIRHGSFDQPIVCDLKTRSAGKGAYRSDFVQVEAYATMYEEMTGLSVGKAEVLVVREDGTWDVYQSPLPRGVFREVKTVYDTLKGVR